MLFYAFSNGKSGDIFVQKAPAATIETLVASLKQILNKPQHEVKIIGTRHGEKLYEALLSREEMAQASDLGEYYRIPPDLRDLNYGKFYDAGELKVSESVEYNSHNTKRLGLGEMIEFLGKLNFVKALNEGVIIEPEES